MPWLDTEPREIKRAGYDWNRYDTTRLVCWLSIAAGLALQSMVLAAIATVAIALAFEITWTWIQFVQSRMDRLRATCLELIKLDAFAAEQMRTLRSGATYAVVWPKGEEVSYRRMRVVPINQSHDYNFYMSFNSAEYASNSVLTEEMILDAVRKRAVALGHILETL